MTSDGFWFCTRGLANLFPHSRREEKMNMELLRYAFFGLVCVAILFLPGYLLDRRAARNLLKEVKGMRVRRRREDLLCEFILCTADIPKGDPRYMLMLFRAKEIDEEMHAAFPKEELQDLAPIVSQWTLFIETAPADTL
jgi:hypothetical protein